MNKILFCVVFLTCTYARAFATADEDANPETKTLLNNLLHKFSGEGILFGHQNDVIGGKSNGGWMDDYYQVSPDTIYNSDIYQVCGDYPAVHGFDIGGIGVAPLHANLDWHNLEFMRKAIIAAYHRKAIVTVSYHMHNPITFTVIDSVDYTDSITTGMDTIHIDSIMYTSTYNYSAWIDSKDAETYNPFTKGLLVQGSALNDTLNVFLTAAGNYFNSLTTSDTIPNPDFPSSPIIRDITVPIIFRPYHELNGGHFWWGVNTCTEEQYIALWKYTYTYLTEFMGVHNLLYCFSPYGKTSEEAYLYGYPGDEYVDILGFEATPDLSSTSSTAAFNSKVDVVFNIAQEKNKPFALTETGFKSPTIANVGATYFSDYFNWIYDDNQARFISYILFWRNLSGEFKVPYIGNDLVSDFQEVYNSPHLALFESDLAEAMLNYGLGPYVMHPNDFITASESSRVNEVLVWQSNGTIQVHIADATPFNIQIYDLKGQQYYSENVTGAKWSHHVKGENQLYIVKINTKTAVYGYKVWVP